MAEKHKPNEINITRIYDAPVKTVWEAWVDPDQVAQWWGPRGFTITTRSKDVRTGGTWDYTMHGPDGKDWENYTRFLEVDKYKRLVYDHGGTKTTPPMFRVTVLFTEVKGKTKMEMTMALPNAEAAKETKKFIKSAGGDATWDRLAEYLAKESSGQEKFVITRSFHTDVATMFDVWTNPKHFEKWLPPTGFEMKIEKGDIKPGSSIFYSMFNDQFKMYGTVKYMEVNRPDRIVYTQQFSDEKGNVSRHPGAPTWPETMLTTVTFTQEDEEHTRVNVVWEIHGKYTQAEMDAFIAEKPGMTQGWGGSFDKLDEYLEKI